jgi:hypothetical protein
VVLLNHFGDLLLSLEWFCSPISWWFALSLGSLLSNLLSGLLSNLLVVFCSVSEWFALSSVSGFALVS